MVCPKCGGKVDVMETRNDFATNTIYRERFCKRCWRTFYTIESVAEGNDEFHATWSRIRKESRLGVQKCMDMYKEGTQQEGTK